jgi:hypothetical protein
VVAAAKVAAGLVATAVVVARTPAAAGRPLLLGAVTSTFAAAGALLLRGGRVDRRALYLGTAFLLVASTFAESVFQRFGVGRASGATALDGLVAVQVGALVAYYLWAFASDFPRAEPGRAGERASRVGRAVSAAWGAALVAANAALFAAHVLGAGDVVHALAPWGRFARGPFFWPPVVALSLGALAHSLWRVRRTRGEERSRAALLGWSLVVGAGPTVAEIVAVSLIPDPDTRVPLRVVGWVVYPALLSTPFTIAYAVLVRRALDVRLVVRRALQYALARSVARAAVAVPLVVAPFALYRNRDAQVGQLLAAPGGALLVGTLAFGALALRFGAPLLDAVDRRFFREQYDAQRILGQLVERCRGAATAAELCAVLEGEVDRALHLERARVLLLDPAAQHFAARAPGAPPAGDVRPLPAGSALAALLAAAGPALAVDLEQPSPALAALPDDDRHWLADADARLLLPLRDPGRRVVGVVALGAKRSELPLSADDRALLAAAAAAAEMALSHLGLSAGSPAPGAAPDGADPHAADLPAAECVRCGAVQPPGEPDCGRCGGPTAPCALPHLVGGKFAIDERVGAGGMGVVYRGMDVHLGRLVAVKTLPEVTPDEAVRLRREARTMAAVAHPHLALIYGVETWHGRPMLVVEYLAGGTLAARLARRPLTPAAAVELGLALAAGLGAVHRAGVVHGDVKPSNVGYAADGTPKLLDFGLARLLTALDPAPRRAVARLAGAGGPAAGAPAAVGGSYDASVSYASISLAGSESVLRGTPRYMAPEALRGEPASPAFDLWSAALTVYEAVAGRLPGVPAGAPVPDLRTAAPDAPPALARALALALAPDPRRRPPSAEAFAALLRAS